MTGSLSRRVLAAPPRSWAYIEGKARELLELVHPQGLLKPCKTPMEQLFEGGLREVLGVEYEIAPDEDREGGYFPEGNVIALPESTYFDLLDGVGRARFTVGHEIGHAVLHGPYVQGVLNRSLAAVVLPRNEVRPYQDIEKQADVFSSELLMPTPQVELLLKQGYVTEDFMEIFGVSYSAAEVKISRVQK